MTHPLLAAFAAVSLLATPTGVSAQSAAPVAAPQPGLPIADVRAWLISLGAEVSEINREQNETYLSVTDGGVTWALFFYGCDNDVCGDVQFSAVFANATITPTLVNDWNQNRRYLKAFYANGADGGGASIVQYDVLLNGGLGVEQLNDPVAVWVSLLNAFATHVGYFQPEAAPAAAAPQQ